MSLPVNYFNKFVQKVKKDVSLPLFIHKNGII